jgi:hypothetical protein
MADEREETIEIGLPIRVRHGVSREVVIPAFGPHLQVAAAEVVGVIESDESRAVVFLEPRRRADGRTGVTEGWDEEAWRDVVRAAARALGYGVADAYALVWNPDGDRAEEPLAPSAAEAADDEADQP